MELRKLFSFLLVLLCCGLLVVGCSDSDDDSNESDDDTEEVVDGGETTPGNDDAVFRDFEEIATSSGRVAFIADSRDGDADSFEGIYTDIEADTLTAAVGTRASLREVASNRDDEDAPDGSPTELPGNAGQVDDFDELVIDGNNIFFTARSDDDEDGIYVDSEGILSKIVDTTDPSPDGGNEFFSAFGPLDAKNGTVAFTAIVTDESEGRETGVGVYTGDLNGNITTIADRNTLAPNVTGGNGNELFRFFRFEHDRVVSIDEAGEIAFIGFYSDGDMKATGLGIFTATSEETVTHVVDTDTDMPGTSDNEFEFFSSVSISEGNVAFIGYDESGGGGLNSEMRKAKRAERKSDDEKTRIFRKRDGDFCAGVYSNLSGSLTNIADSNTTIPDGSGNTFYYFQNAVIDGDRIVFSGVDEEFFDILASEGEVSSKEARLRDLNGTSGIYVFHSGDTIEKVIDNRDVIPGSSDQTFRFALELDFEDDEINASIVTSGGDLDTIDDIQADSLLTIQDTPSIVSFRTQKDRSSTVLNWQTVCGEVLGFHVWRSSGEEYERITSSAVAPQRHAGGKAVKFSYTDTPSEDGQYFYKLEIMKLDGSREMIRPAYND